MTKRRSDCPDCQGSMQPIKLIDATHPGWDSKGVQHVGLSYAAPDATKSHFVGRIESLGVVKGFICPDCGRIVLYGEPSGA